MGETSFCCWTITMNTVSCRIRSWFVFLDEIELCQLKPRVTSAHACEGSTGHELNLPTSDAFQQRILNLWDVIKPHIGTIYGSCVGYGEVAPCSDFGSPWYFLSIWRTTFTSTRAKIRFCKRPHLFLQNIFIFIVSQSTAHVTSLRTIKRIRNGRSRLFFFIVLPSKTTAVTLCFQYAYICMYYRIWLRSDLEYNEL